MKSVEIKGLLNKMKEVTLSVGDRERKNEYHSALQVRMFTNATSITVTLVNLNPLTSV